MEQKDPIETNETENIQNKNVEKKGDGTMSAITQNCTYIYGKEKKGAERKGVISAERLKEIKDAVKKYRPDGK